MNNQDIRQEITQSGFRYWQVADMLNMTDGMFSRLLRHELPEEKKARIRDAIAQLKAGA